MNYYRNKFGNTVSNVNGNLKDYPGCKQCSCGHIHRKTYCDRCGSCH